MTRSYLVAAAILFAFILWMLSGGVDGGAEAETETETEIESEVEVVSSPAQKKSSVLTRVKVATYQGAPMEREVVIHGSTEARRSVTLRAEGAGQVAELIARRGSEVKAGDRLVRLKLDDRREKLAQAKALLRQRELEYQAARSLKKQGLKAETQLADAFSLLEFARAQLRSAELNLARAEIIAPFDGVIQQHHAEEGDYLMAGDPVASIIERDPLTVGGDLSEREVGQIKMGMAATAQLPDGATLTGRISYIAPAATTETRSFRVEMEAPNPQGVSAGVTATIRVPLDKVDAHKLSPALLSLSDSGVIGVKSVDDEGTVHFHEIALLRSDSEGLWVSGLPPRLRLITVGQGFVRDGDRVEALEAE